MTNEAPDRLAQLQVAAETAKKLLMDQSRTMTLLQPKLKRVEYLDRELQRKHETCRISLEQNQIVDVDYDAIQALTDELLIALKDLVQTPGGT